MFRMYVRELRASVTDIFNFKNEDSKGLTLYLFTLILTSFYNVFITGIFYTGFLSMYGMTITDAGIITFIPYIGSLFSIFSSKVLSRFKRRKPILIASRIYFYAMYIIASTLMPQFVHDPKARLTWFVVILFLTYSVYSLFSGGFTLWFCKLFPVENDRRTKYVQYQQIICSIMSSLILLLSSFLTDAVAGSAFQNELILGLRYFAFGLVVVETFIMCKIKEKPADDQPELKLRKVFTLPFKHKKFLYCMLMMFAWNYIANLTNGVWSYHCLNHLNLSYTMINTMSVMYTIILMLTSSYWSKLIRRYSWIRVFGIAELVWIPTEIIAFLITPERAYLFVIMSFLQNILNVGLNLSYANILYMNLPQENSTAHIAFNTIGCNLFAFLGLMTGTFVSSITGDTTINFLGMPTYSVQFLTFARFITMGIMGLILIIKWRSFTKDSDIAEIDAFHTATKGNRGI